MITFNDYLAMVSSAKVDHPEWRMGQTYFSCAHAAPGVFVGLWNDKQTDPNVVIDKLFEVARANAGANA